MGRARKSTAPRPAWSERIITLRKAKGLSQQGLAQAMGTSQSTVAGWESGENFASHGHLTKLAEVLGVDPAEIAPTVLASLQEDQDPYLAATTDQLFGSMFANLHAAVKATGDRSISLETMAMWARRIWRQAGGTEHAGPDSTIVRTLIADMAQVVRDSMAKKSDR